MGIQGDLLQFLIVHSAFCVAFKKIPLSPPFSKGEADSAPLITEGLSAEDGGKAVEEFFLSPFDFIQRNRPPTRCQTG